MRAFLASHPQPPSRVTLSPLRLCRLVRASWALGTRHSGSAGPKVPRGAAAAERESLAAARLRRSGGPPQCAVQPQPTGGRDRRMDGSWLLVAVQSAARSWSRPAARMLGARGCVQHANPCDASPRGKSQLLRGLRYCGNLGAAAVDGNRGPDGRSGPGDVHCRADRTEREKKISAEAWQRLGLADRFFPDSNGHEARPTPARLERHRRASTRRRGCAVVVRVAQRE